MNTISRQKIIDVCAALGLNPADVAEIRITPDEVAVTTFDRDTDGHKILGPCPICDGPVKTTRTFPIANDEEHTA